MKEYRLNLSVDHDSGGEMVHVTSDGFNGHAHVGNEKDVILGFFKNYIGDRPPDKLTVRFSGFEMESINYLRKGLKESFKDMVVDLVQK